MTDADFIRNKCDRQQGVIVEKNKKPNPSMGWQWV
jgi:hypothetical protein